MIFNFFGKLQFWLILASFLTLGSILGAQTPSNLLHHGSCYRQACPKKYFGPWEDGIQADRPELQCKTCDFQNGWLWGQFSPGSEAGIWNPVYHVVYPLCSTPGKLNFWATSSEKNVGRFGGPRTPCTGRMGVAKYRFKPRRTSGASFVKIRVGPRTAHLIDSVHLSCIHS